MTISPKDKAILLDMAKRQVEIAHSPKMEKLWQDWRAHGAFRADSRPMMMIELGTFAQDIIPALMRCEGEDARRVEWMLHCNVVNHTLFEDDTIVKDYLPVFYECSFKPFDLDVQVEHTEGLGHQFVPVIADLEEDFEKLKPSTFGIDKTNVERVTEQYAEIFGDVLPVRLRADASVFTPTQDIVHLMGMENMYVNLCTNPDLYHKMMQMLVDDYLAFIDLMEKEGALLPTYDEALLLQGSTCFNNRLPRTGDGHSAKDVWCFMDSQESAGISPEMFGEFVAPYYRQISDRFGRLSYGCCEAVDPIWDIFLKDLDNLGKVSISPWCNEELMGERLRGKEIVYLRKPHPNYLGVGDVLDEDAVEKHFAKTVEAARGCTLEIIQRDVYQVSKSPEKVRRYVQLMRKACEKHQK